MCNSEAAFQTIDVNEPHSGRQLDELYHLVARLKGRVEVTCADGGEGEACVIISKSELEALERALEIYANTDGVKAMVKALTQLAAVTEDRASV